MYPREEVKSKSLNLKSNNLFDKQKTFDNSFKLWMFIFSNRVYDCNPNLISFDDKKKMNELIFQWICVMQIEIKSFCWIRIVPTRSKKVKARHWVTHHSNMAWKMFKGNWHSALLWQLALLSRESVAWQNVDGFRVERNARNSKIKTKKHSHHSQPLPLK